MTTFARVELYPCFEIQTGTDSGGNPVYTKYYEDSLHRPVFPAPADSTSTPPEPRQEITRFNNITPRKGHELDEIELPIRDEMFTVEGSALVKLPQLICL